MIHAFIGVSEDLQRIKQLDWKQFPSRPGKSLLFKEYLALVRTFATIFHNCSCSMYILLLHSMSSKTQKKFSQILTFYWQFTLFESPSNPQWARQPGNLPTIRSSMILFLTLLTFPKFSLLLTSIPILTHSSQLHCTHTSGKLC